MPSQVTVKNKYRYAKCCGNCRSEKNRYCALLGIQVNPGCICSKYSGDPKRAPVITMCAVCAFGLSGDRSCEFGCALDTTPQRGCYAGKKQGS